MEPDEINVLPLAVLCHFQEINQAEESGLSCQLRGDIGKSNGFDGIHLDLAFFHPVT